MRLDVAVTWWALHLARVGWGNPCTQPLQPDLEKGLPVASPYPLPPTWYAEDIGEKCKIICSASQKLRIQGVDCTSPRKPRESG